MITEVILVLPIYILIFLTIYRFRHIIKAMTDIDNIIFDSFSDSLEQEDTARDSTINKRKFLAEKIKNGEPISNSKTPWTLERLEKASNKMIDKLYEKYQNPPPVKINKQEALEKGKTVCPVVIEMYAEGLKTLVDQMPYFKGRYIINVEKLKRNISTNKLFCDNLAIKIGSKMIEQMGNNSPMEMGLTLASMTWDSIERVESSEVEIKSDSDE